MGAYLFIYGRYGTKLALLPTPMPLPLPLGPLKLMVLTNIISPLPCR
jgi:hypothetical protein